MLTVPNPTLKKSHPPPPNPRCKFPLIAHLPTYEIKFVAALHVLQAKQLQNSWQMIMFGKKPLKCQTCLQCGDHELPWQYFLCVLQSIILNDNNNNFMNYIVSVWVFSIEVLIVDTLIDRNNITNATKLLINPSWQGGAASRLFTKLGQGFEQGTTYQETIHLVIRKDLNLGSLVL